MSRDIKHQVFISYARSDRTYASALGEKLRGHGLQVWWDAELQPGTQFRGEIAQKLNDASVVISLWSTESVGSDWVVDEAQRAHAQHKLIPVHVGSDDMASEAATSKLVSQMPQPLSNYVVLPFDIAKILKAISSAFTAVKDATISQLRHVQLQSPPIFGKIKPSRVRAAIRRAKREMTMDASRTQIELFVLLKTLTPSVDHVRTMPRGRLFNIEDIEELTSLADLIERQEGVI